MKPLLALLFTAATCFAQQSTYTGQVVLKDSTGHVVANQGLSSVLDLSSINWLHNGQPYTGSFSFQNAVPPFVAPSTGPTPPPPPPPPPVMPTAPPAAVTNCPTLAFSDNFHGQNGSIGYELSEWGPLNAPYRWIVHKADGYDLDQGYGNHASGASWAFGTTQGFLSLDMHNYVQSAQYPKGDNGWFQSSISSLSYINGAVTPRVPFTQGQSTGFKASAPFYWECAVWIPKLAPGDAPGIAGLWPSIALYTDPAASASGTVGGGPFIEIDVFELYSIDYTIPHCSWHVWNNGSQQGAYGTTFSHGAFPDFSEGWHIWGLWADGPTGNIHWYLDGKEIFTQPMPSSANDPNLGSKPLYIQISNSFGGGWNLSMSPSQYYPMGVAYVGCWTH